MTLGAEEATDKPVPAARKEKVEFCRLLMVVVAGAELM